MERHARHLDTFATTLVAVPLCLRVTTMPATAGAVLPVLHTALTSTNLPTGAQALEDRMSHINSRGNKTTLPGYPLAQHGLWSTQESTG